MNDFNQSATSEACDSASSRPKSFFMTCRLNIPLQRNKRHQYGVSFEVSCCSTTVLADESMMLRVGLPVLWFAGDLFSPGW